MNTAPIRKAWQEVIHAAVQYCDALRALAETHVGELELAIADSRLQNAALLWAKMVLSKDGKKSPRRPK